MLRDRPVRTQVALERTAAGKYRTPAATGDVAKVVSPQLADAFGTTSQSFIDTSMSNLLTFFAAHQREVTSTEINGALRGDRRHEAGERGGSDASLADGGDQ